MSVVAFPDDHAEKSEASEEVVVFAIAIFVCTCWTESWSTCIVNGTEAKTFIESSNLDLESEPSYDLDGSALSSTKNATSQIVVDGAPFSRVSASIVSTQ